MGLFSRKDRRDSEGKPNKPGSEVQDTLSINRTQQLVTILAQPLVEIAWNHLVNMIHTEENMKQIRDLQRQTTNLRSQIKKKSVVDRETENEYHDVAQTAANRKKLLEEEKEKYKNLEFEHDSIRDFCAEAAVFLLENSMQPTGDPYLQQIQKLISDEESKIKLEVDMEMSYEMFGLLDQYKERVKNIQEDIRANKRTPVTCDELLHKLDTLALLQSCGEKVKQLKATWEENVLNLEKKSKEEGSDSVDNDSKSNRSLETAERVPAQKAKDILSEKQTEQMVTITANPLIELVRNHLVNMKHTEEYMKQVKGIQNCTSNLQYQVTKKIVILEFRKRAKPRIVCKSPKCIIWQKRPNEWTPDYRICHDEGDTDTSPVPFSTKNWSYCMACGCHKKNHEHQLYQSETRAEEMVDKRARYELEDVAQMAGNVKKVLEEEQQKDKQLELEHDLIRDFCAEAAVFLLKNSAEDPYLLQIQNMVTDEETKMNGEVANMYYELLTFLEQYKEKVKQVQEDIQEGRRSPVVDYELMHKMDSLTLQPHSGEQVKRLRAICQDHIKELEQKV